MISHWVFSWWWWILRAFTANNFFFFLNIFQLASAINKRKKKKPTVLTLRGASYFFHPAYYENTCLATQTDLTFIVAFYHIWDGSRCFKGDLSPVVTSLSRLPQRGDRLHALMPPAALRTQWATSAAFTSLHGRVPLRSKEPTDWARVDKLLQNRPGWQVVLKCPPAAT